MQSIAIPETRYANNGGVHIAYQVLGDGPMDLVFVMGWVTHLDFAWMEPGYARMLRRLASFSRLIVIDKRGTGLSDRAQGLATLEERVDDVRVVMDAADSKEAAAVGVSEGGPMLILLAASHPERVKALVLIGTSPRFGWAPDWPWGATPKFVEERLELLERGWGTIEWARQDLARRCPPAARDEQFVRWWMTFTRNGGSPGSAMAINRMNVNIDTRPVLSAIRVPTLIVHRVGDMIAPIESARYMAARIPGAKFVELPGDEHLPYVGDQDQVWNPVEEFLGVRRPPAPEPDTVLATALSVEIADVARLVATLGERTWHNVSEQYAELARGALERSRGRAIATASDRLLAVFDGPSRAIRCAQSIVEQASTIGLKARAGLHTGECTVTNGTPGGLPLEVAAWVMSQAQPGEVLASNTVRDLVPGSGITFDETLTRAPTPPSFGTLRVYRVETARSAPRKVVRAPRQDSLTRREREIVALLARGRTNREIADLLVLSERTVENHVSNVLGKLNLDTRAQVAIWVLSRDDARTVISV